MPATIVGNKDNGQRNGYMVTSPRGDMPLVGIAGMAHHNLLHINLAIPLLGSTCREREQHHRQCNDNQGNIIS